jgi:hypothetical protein
MIDKRFTDGGCRLGYGTQRRSPPHHPSVCSPVCVDPPSRPASLFIVLVSKSPRVRIARDVCQGVRVNVSPSFLVEDHACSTPAPRCQIGSPYHEKIPCLGPRSSFFVEIMLQEPPTNCSKSRSFPAAALTIVGCCPFLLAFCIWLEPWHFWHGLRAGLDLSNELQARICSSTYQTILVCMRVLNHPQLAYRVEHPLLLSLSSSLPSRPARFVLLHHLGTTSPCPTQT